MKSFKELTSTNEKYDAYYAMVDAKAMAKKKGGKPEDYIDDMMKKRGYKKSNYSGHGVWKWVKEDSSGDIMDDLAKALNMTPKQCYNAIKLAIKAGATANDLKKKFGIAIDDAKRWITQFTKEDVSEGTMQQGIFDKDVKKRKDAARKLVFFLRTKKNLKIGPKDEKQGDSNKAIDAYMKELMKYVFDDEMLDNLYPTGKNERVRANDVVVKRLKKMGVKVK